MRQNHFPKLSKKLFFYAFLIPVTFVFVVSVATSLTTYFLYRSSFVTSLENNASILISRLDIGFSQLEAKVNSTASNEYFLNAVDEKNESRIAENLQNLATSDSCFIGAIYYSDDLSVTSSDVSGSPSYFEIKSLSDFSSFLTSDRLSFSSVRSTCISKAYYNYAYTANDGILSIFRKIEDGDSNIKGMLEIDLSSQSVYNDFLSLDGFPYMSDALVYLAYDNNILYKSNESRLTWDYSSFDKTKKMASQDGSYIAKKMVESYSELAILDRYSLMISVPQWNFWKIIVTINCSIVAADLVFIGLFYLIARFYSKKDIERLNRIATEMGMETGLQIEAGE